MTTDKKGFGASKRRSPEHYARILKLRVENIYKRSEKHFWERVDKKGVDDCWEWTRCKNMHGYGKLSWRGRLTKAHRVAWMLTYGDLKPTDWILHHCDNPACCNPKHLYVGDHAQNTRDAVERHCYRFGADHPMAKLTEKDVMNILALKGKDSQNSIANRFGVNSETIRQIMIGNHWKHISV